MEFDCKLAHCDEIKRVSSFRSIKELYEQISRVFQVDANEILYCTLNTHNFRDTDSVLSNYLSFGDLIIVHLCGASRILTLKKTQEFLGLTITDNANGRSFVKRVKSEDEHVEFNIKPGDHIASINSKSTLGLRHYEVAKEIRLLPKDSNFTMCLIEPKHVKYLVIDEETNRENSSHGNALGQTNVAPNKLELQSTINSSTLNDDLVNSSLPIDRLLSKSNQINGHNIDSKNSEDSYKSIIERINTSLESFMGISDNLLAIKIYRLARENKESFEAFSKALADSDLKVFNFDEEMKDQLWKCAIDSAVI